ncbi:MAG: cation:proton antiporter [Gemmataceae bacterium]
MSNEHVLTSLLSIVVLGISAQWMAWRLRIPSILLLLIFGFLAGPGATLIPTDSWLGRVIAPFHIDPDNLFGDGQGKDYLLLPLVSLGVAVILFEGGMSLKFSELPHLGHVVTKLVTVGVLITWLASACAAWLLIDGMTPRVALLLGALLVVSGPTVVGPMLQQMRLIGRTGPILKWEGIVIDPIGVLLGLVVYYVVVASQAMTAVEEVALAVLKTFLIGGGLGLAMGAVLAVLLARFWIPDYLQNAVTLMFVLAGFVAANTIQEEAGLFTVTVMGVFLANQRFASVEHIIEFKENLRVLLISALFIVLAARLRLEDLRQAGWASLWFVAVLIVVVRPLAVWASTLGSGLSWKERAFLSWMAPRGIVAAAVSSIFALYLLDDHIAGSHLLVPVVFTTIIGTVTIYGLTAPGLARWLGLSEPDPQGVLIVGAHSWARALAKVLRDQGVPVVMLDNNRADLAAARMDNLNTVYGSLHSDGLLENLDLTGIGKLLALSPTDSDNVLAVHRFRMLFGRAHVFQLCPEPEPGAKKHPARHTLGRLLFGSDVTFRYLDDRFRAGATIKATPLTEAFAFKDFAAMHGRNYVPLFVVKLSGRLVVVTAGMTIQPQPGDILISLTQSAEQNGNSSSKNGARSAVEEAV